MLYFDELQADCKPSQRNTLVGAFFRYDGHVIPKVGQKTFVFRPTRLPILFDLSKDGFKVETAMDIALRDGTPANRLRARRKVPTLTK